MTEVNTFLERHRNNSGEAAGAALAAAGYRSKLVGQR